MGDGGSRPLVQDPVPLLGGEVALEEAGGRLVVGHEGDRAPPGLALRPAGAPARLVAAVPAQADAGRGRAPGRGGACATADPASGGGQYARAPTTTTPTVTAAPTPRIHPTRHRLPSRFVNSNHRLPEPTPPPIARGRRTPR
jgi:hypothetical protein